MVSGSSMFLWDALLIQVKLRSLVLPSQLECNPTGLVENGTDLMSKTIITVRIRGELIQSFTDLLQF